MRIRNAFAGRGKMVAAGIAAVAVVAGATTGTAVAAKQITSFQIKDGTIQTRDLTKNNFARFTSTETVVTGETPVSTNPAFNGQRVVDLAATGTTPIATVVLDKGSWKISGIAQFRHYTGNPTDPDYGTVTVGGLATGFGSWTTGDIPNAGANPAQVDFEGTITITANDTPVVVYGALNGSNNGQAGATVTATQYKYVKVPNSSH